MTRKPDLGRSIKQWARALDKRQLAELMAMWWSQTSLGKPSILSADLKKTDEHLAGLIRAKFITWKRTPGNYRMRETSITRIGMLVLHAAIEAALLQSGAIEPYEYGED